MKPHCTTTRSNTREQPKDEAPETEDDILERMIILSTPAEAKKAAIQVIEAKNQVRFSAETKPTQQEKTQQIEKPATT